MRTKLLGLTAIILITLATLFPFSAAPLASPATHPPGILLAAAGDVSAPEWGPVDAVAPVAPNAPDTIAPASDAPSWLLDLVVKYPWLSTIVTIIGVFRLITKPLMSLVLAVVAATPTTADDKFIDEAEHSTWWKYVTYGLNWLFSIKIGPEAKKV